MATATAKVMTITAPTFIAQATWRKRGSKWTCINAGPALQWMIGKPYQDVWRYVERRHWSIAWSEAAKSA